MLVWPADLGFAARHRCFPRYAGPGIPPRRYAARRLSPLVVVVVEHEQLEGFFISSYGAAVRVLFRGDACQTDGFRTCTMVGTYGRFGLSIVNPAKGAAKRWRVIKRSPRGNLSAGPGANAFRRCLPERAGRPRLRRFSREGLRCRNRRSAP